MPTLDATPTGASANSYLSHTEAEAFFDNHLGSNAWHQADQADQERALITATQRIDALGFYGFRTAPSQRLQWPRSGVEDLNGTVLDPNTIPRRLKDFTAEYALRLLIEAKLIVDVGVDAYETDDSGEPASPKDGGSEPGAIPKDLLYLIRGLTTSSGVSVDAVRG